MLEIVRKIVSDDIFLNMIAIVPICAVFDVIKFKISWDNFSANFQRTL